MIKLLRTSRGFNIEECVKDCSLSDDSYNELIFGVQYPCCHKILEQIYMSKQMINFQKFNIINVERFLIHLLNIPINYSKEHTNIEILKIVDEIIEYYSRLDQILDKPTTLELIKHAITTLSYKLPDPFQFKEDYNQNEFYSKEVIPVEISKSATNVSKSRKGKVNKEDLTFLTRNCINEIQVLCKSKYYETANEIIFIYRQIGARVFYM